MERFSLKKQTKVQPLLKEEWRAIPDFDGYQVSNFGRVKRLAGKDLRGRHDERILVYTDYHVYLKKNGVSHRFSVAYLVLRVFVGEPPTPYGIRKECTLARHLDDNKTNNVLTNLAWGSNKDNQQDAIRNGTLSAGSPAKMKMAETQRGQKRPAVSEYNRNRILPPDFGTKIAAKMRGKKRTLASIKKQMQTRLERGLISRADILQKAK